MEQFKSQAQRIEEARKLNVDMSGYEAELKKLDTPPKPEYVPPANKTETIAENNITYATDHKTDTEYVMLFILIAVMAVCAVWYYSMLRGRLTVRASTYLMLISEGNSEDHANKIALAVDLFAANQLKNGAMYHVNEVYGGRQLALIADARLQGFKG